MVYIAERLFFCDWEVHAIFYNTACFLFIFTAKTSIIKYSMMEKKRSRSRSKEKQDRRDERSGRSRSRSRRRSRSKPQRERRRSRSTYLDQLKGRPEGLCSKCIGNDIPKHTCDSLWPLPELTQDVIPCTPQQQQDLESFRLPLEPEECWFFRKRFIVGNYGQMSLPRLLLYSQMYVRARLYDQTFSPVVDQLISTMENKVLLPTEDFMVEFESREQARTQKSD